MNAPESGWYPDPNGPPGQERWWDALNNTWGEWTRQGQGPAAPPNWGEQRKDGGGFRVGGSRRSWIALGVAALLAVLWLNGTFDEPLSSVGLNSKECAENVFGNTMCGDELVAFCRDHYAPKVNADTCDKPLRDAGVDPASLSAGIEQAEQAEAAEIETEVATETAKAEDSSAKSDARIMVTEVESCYTDREDYRRCRTDEDLDYPGLLIGSSPGEVEVIEATRETYIVVAHSLSGNDFSVKGGTAASLERTCTAVIENAGCISGTW